MRRTKQGRKLSKDLSEVSSLGVMNPTKEFYPTNQIREAFEKLSPDFDVMQQTKKPFIRPLNLNAVRLSGGQHDFQPKQMGRDIQRRSRLNSTDNRNTFNYHSNRLSDERPVSV